MRTRARAKLAASLGTDEMNVVQSLVHMSTTSFDSFDESEMEVAEVLATMSECTVFPTSASYFDNDLACIDQFIADSEMMDMGDDEWRRVCVYRSSPEDEWLAWTKACMEALA